MAEGHKISDLFNSIEEVKIRMSSYERVVLEDQDGNEITMKRGEYDQMQRNDIISIRGDMSDVKKTLSEILDFIKTPQEIIIENGEGQKKWQAAGDKGYNQFVYNKLNEHGQRLDEINDRFSFKYLGKRIVALFAGFAIIFETLSNSENVIKWFLELFKK